MHREAAAGVCDKADIAEPINEVVGYDGRKIGVGHAVKADILNPLYITATF